MIRSYHRTKSQGRATAIVRYLGFLLLLSPTSAWAQDAGATAPPLAATGAPPAAPASPAPSTPRGLPIATPVGQEAGASSNGATPHPDRPEANDRRDLDEGEIRARLERVERELEVAREREAQKRAHEAEGKKPPPLFSAEPGKGIVIRNEKGTYSLTIRPRVQIRDVFQHDDKVDTNEVNVKTLRLVFHGNVLGPKLKYFVQLAFGSGDFEKDNPSPIYDAFLESSHERDLNVRVGQFLVPFDRARTTVELALQFVDRQQVVRELSLDRDVGIMFHSSDLFGAGKRLGYHVFVGGGEGKNRVGGQEIGPLVIGRFVVRPFGAFDDDQEGDLARLPKPRLAIGIAGAYNVGTNRQNSTYGTVFSLGTVDYAHGAVDAVFKYGGFSLSAEGLLRKASRDSLNDVVNGKAVKEWTRTGTGYFVQTGMMLSERAEAVARWEQLFVTTSSDPTFLDYQRHYGKQLGGGLNLYLNGHFLKVQGDYFYQFGDHPTDGRHVLRAQLDATF